MSKTNTAVAVKADTKAADTKAAEAQTETQTADIFAGLPVTTTADGVELPDLSGVATNEPYKYADVHSRAKESNSPMLLNYKHGQSYLVPGSVRRELKPGSVYGTIQQIVNQAGKGGIPVYELITRLRKAQIGNKRSKYCNALPPVGWAEGWLNTAITKSIVGIHPTKTASHFAPKEAAAEPEKKAAAAK